MSITTDRSRLILVQALVVLTLAGCSAAQPPDQNLNLPEKNLAGYVLPLDEFMPPISDKVPYARALLIQPCMDGKGFVRSVPYQDVTKLDQPLRRPFTLEVAKQYGYHSSRTVDPQTQAWTDYSFKQFSVAEQAAFDACFAQISGDLPELSTESANFAAGLASNAYDQSFKDADVVTASGKWHDCMMPLGVADLPELPGQMPSDSVVKKFGLNPEPGITTVASTEEIELAVADATCRNEAEYPQARYDAEWDLQVIALGDNFAELERVRREMQAVDLKVNEVITNNSPQLDG